MQCIKGEQEIRKDLKPQASVCIHSLFINNINASLPYKLDPTVTSKDSVKFLRSSETLLHLCLPINRSLTTDWKYFII